MNILGITIRYYLVLHEYHSFYPPEKSWRSEITYLQRIFHCQMTGKHTSKFLSFIGCLHELSFLCCVIFRIPARFPRNRGTPSYFEYMTATFLVGTLLFLHLDFLKFTLNRAQSRLFFFQYAEKQVSVNHLDIAPRHAGAIFGLGNTFATLAGLVSTPLTGRGCHGDAICCVWLATWRWEVQQWGRVDDFPFGWSGHFRTGSVSEI